MRRLLLATLLAAIGSTQALAGNPVTTISIVDDSGLTWTEALGTSTVMGANGQAGLLQFDDSTGNFTMLQGSAGQSITTDNIDAWVWQDGAWTWHSAETDTSGNYMAQMQLQALAGQGDPDLSYAITVTNNTGRTQTYTISADETIAPPLGGANMVSANISGILTATSGTLQVTQSQQLLLSQDGGSTLVNAGVDVSKTFATASSGNYSASAAAAGALGNWDYMIATTTFTLSGGKGTASIQGYASITAVPETDSYAMLLAGLGMLGFMARRRQVI